MLKYIGYLFLLPVFNPCSILFKKKKASTYWSLFICWSSLPTGKYRIEFSGALAQKDLQARVPVPVRHHPHCWLLTLLYVPAHPCEIPALRSSVVTLIELPIKPQHLQSDSMALAAKLHPKMVLIHFFAIVNQVCNSQLHLFLQGRADLYGFEVFIHSHRCMSFLSVLEGEVPRDDIRLWHPPFRIGLSGDLCLASNFLAAHTVEII